MDRIRYALAVLLVATVPPAVIWWYVVHPFVRFWRRLGPGVTLGVVGVAMVALMIALGMARRWLVGADLGTNWPLAGTGAVCIVIAFVMALLWRWHWTLVTLVAGSLLAVNARRIPVQALASVHPSGRYAAVPAMP